jgi:hypothetical protein
VTTFLLTERGIKRRLKALNAGGMGRRNDQWRDSSLNQTDARGQARPLKGRFRNNQDAAIGEANNHPRGVSYAHGATSYLRPLNPLYGGDRGDNGQFNVIAHSFAKKMGSRTRSTQRDPQKR